MTEHILSLKTRGFEVRLSLSPPGLLAGARPEMAASTAAFRKKFEVHNREAFWST